MNNKEKLYLVKVANAQQPLPPEAPPGGAPDIAGAGVGSLVGLSKGKAIGTEQGPEWDNLRKAEADSKRQLSNMRSLSNTMARTSKGLDTANKALGQSSFQRKQQALNDYANEGGSNPNTFISPQHAKFHDKRVGQLRDRVTGSEHYNPSEEDLYWEKQRQEEQRGLRSDALNQQMNRIGIGRNMAMEDGTMPDWLLQQSDYNDAEGNPMTNSMYWDWLNDQRSQYGGGE